MIHQKETLNGDVKKETVKRRHEHDTLKGDTTRRH